MMEGGEDTCTVISPPVSFLNGPQIALVKTNVVVSSLSSVSLHLPHNKSRHLIHKFSLIVSAKTAVFFYSLIALSVHQWFPLDSSLDLGFPFFDCLGTQKDDSSEEYITANVVDRNNGRIVATASTVEHSIKNSLECGRSCNAKAATVIGEVLAMRLKVEGLEQGQGRGIHVDVNKEVEKKGFKNRTKVWAVVNALKNHGVKVVLEDNEDNPSRPSF
ncbi:hypothetical protein PVK06_003234 [Gossypium arboreum]|uniref:50S ribosomal L18 n=1 Tax=Gossypium arboreum TaxID=29729 RepID=A0ABR0R6X8_GOSAR|nr:hypothetical protein PVK06_003234 [Gossypium arboreum]